MPPRFRVLDSKKYLQVVILPKLLYHFLSMCYFGNLQVVAAKQLQLSPVLMAATNSTGGVMSKMISPQNVTTGVSTSSLVGKEGQVVARVFKHSLFLAVLLGLLVMAQQYLIPWIIPH